MEKGIIAAAGALVVVPLSIWFYTSDHQLKHNLAETAATKLRSAVENYFPSPQPKCDSAEAVATLKELAVDRLNDVPGLHLLGFSNRNVHDDKRTVDRISTEHLTVDSFRKRGDIGKTGSSCAAQIKVYAGGSVPSHISAEYTIEPTTDGKTMVGAKFRPNR